MNIVLTGFMGTGKSSVAAELSRRLGLELADSDELVEAQAGMRIKEIFGRYGEGRFREMEREAIKRVTSTMEGVILATGGGAVVDGANRAALRSWGTVVCLRASVGAILERVGAGDERPLLNDKKAGAGRRAVEELLKAREGAYNDSDLVIDTTDKDVSQVADEIEAFISR